MLKILFIEMALSTCELWSNGIKMAGFSKKSCKKSHSGWKIRPQTPIYDTFKFSSLLNTSPNLHFFWEGLSPFPAAKSWLRTTPGHKIFVPQKVPLLKIFDDVVACDVWFGSPQSKILAMHAYEREVRGSNPRPVKSNAELPTLSLW